MVFGFVVEDGDDFVGGDCVHGDCYIGCHAQHSVLRYSDEDCWNSLYCLWDYYVWLAALDYGNIFCNPGLILIFLRFFGACVLVLIIWFRFKLQLYLSTKCCNV